MHSKQFTKLPINSQAKPCRLCSLKLWHHVIKCHNFNIPLQVYIKAVCQQKTKIFCIDSTLPSLMLQTQLHVIMTPCYQAVLGAIIFLCGNLVLVNLGFNLVQLITINSAPNSKGVAQLRTFQYCRSSILNCFFFI